MDNRKKSKKRAIFTIGHSTRTLDELIELLRAHGVRRVIDIRTIPGSRRNPQYNRETLGPSLRAAKIGYVHLKSLGGLRKARPDSKNAGWHNASFRGYADYMQTPEIRSCSKTRDQAFRNQAQCSDVRRSSTLALPPLARSGRSYGAEISRRAHHERIARKPAQADIIRAGARQESYIPVRQAHSAQGHEPQIQGEIQVACMIATPVALKGYRTLCLQQE